MVARQYGKICGEGFPKPASQYATYRVHGRASNVVIDAWIFRRIIRMESEFRAWRRWLHQDLIYLTANIQLAKIDELVISLLVFCEVKKKPFVEFLLYHFFYPFHFGTSEFNEFVQYSVKEDFARVLYSLYFCVVQRLAIAAVKGESLTFGHFAFY